MAITTGPNLKVLIDGNKGEEHYNQLMHQWRALDGLVQPVAISMGSTTPPGSSDNGDCHIVGVGATGAWAGMDNRIARYFTVGVGAPAWEFYVPKSGWQMRILSQLDSNGLPRTAEYSGTAWGLVESGAASDVPVEEIATSNYDVDSSRNGAYLRMTATGGTTVTIRTQAIHPLPDNGVWHIRNAGDADMTVVPEGVVLNAPAGGSYTVPPNGIISIKRVAVNEFDLLGVTTGSGESSVVAADFETSAAYLSFTDNAGKVRLNLNESGLGSALGLDGKADAADIGAANGIAPLDGSGRVPSANLPSYVDDVLEYANIGAFPATGEAGKIYISLAAGTDGSGAFPANQQFRWSGSSYQRIVASPGTTDNVPEGSTNQYFTQARVRSSVLTGLAVGVGFTAVLATDTVLQAFNKIQGWLNGLGTASQANVNTSTTDATANRLLRNGDWGPGGYAGVVVAPGNALKSAMQCGLYGVNSSTTDNPGVSSGGVALHLAWNETNMWQMVVSRSADSIYFRRNNGGTWSADRFLWHDGNLVKTTSATDTTAGSMLQVGDFGISTPVLLTTPNLSSVLASGSYYANSPTNGPGGNGWLERRALNSTFFTQEYIQVSNGDRHHQSNLNGVLTPWRRYWDTGNTSANVQTMLSSADNAAIRSNINAAKKTAVVTVSTSTHNVDTANESGYHRFTFSGAKSVTVRPNSTHALPADGAWVLRNANTGNLTIVAGSGVTINVPYGGTLVLEPGMVVTLQKIGTDEYDLIGQTVPA